MDAAPAVWQSFIASHIALCQLITDELKERLETRNTEKGEGGGEEDEEEEEGEGEEEDEDMFEETIGMLEEQIDALERIQKKKLPFNDRMGLLGMLVELTSDQLPLLASLDDAEKAAELQVEDIVTAALHSTLHYGQDCIQRAGGLSVASSNKLQQDSEMEALMCMRLLDALMGCTLNEAPHARRAVLAHLPSIVEWLMAVGLSRHRSSTARQAALSVLSNVVEADPALLSPPPSEGGEESQAAAEASTTPQLSPASRAAVLSGLLDSAFALCGEEEAELSVEVGHFSSQNLGTALLDVSDQRSLAHCTATRPSRRPLIRPSPVPLPSLPCPSQCLCSSVTPASAVASAVLSRATALLSGSAAAGGQTGNGAQAALLCLSVLPSTAPTYCGEHLTQLVQLVTPSLSSSVDSVKAAAFVCIGEALESIPEARVQYADTWLSLILQTLSDDSQPLPVKHKVTLPLIQLTDGTEDEEHEEKEEGTGDAKDGAEFALSVSQSERIYEAVLSLLQRLKDEGIGGGAEAKPKWQFVALLAAVMENSGQTQRQREERRKERRPSTDC